MNIFVLDEDFDKCAQYHVDRHIVKMITELAQMLSTTVRLSGIDAGYKLTHQNHPCTKWTRESLSNWLWLKTLANHLNTEWQFRYDHSCNHKSFDVIELLPIPDIVDVGLTPFALAMPDDCKLADPIQSYRLYYKKYKTHLFNWKKREMPEWLL